MTSKPKRLHPISLLIFTYESIKQIIFLLIIFLLIIFILGFSRISSIAWLIVIVVALVIINLIWDIMDYFMFTYQILESEVVIRSGVLVKKVNHVPFDRIQNITTNQWFFLKPFGLEELEIETAGQSNKAEVELKAVPDTLKKEIDLLRYKKGTTINNAQTEENVYTISWPDLWKFSLTSPAYFSALLAVLALYGKVKDAIKQNVYQNIADRMTHLGFLILIIVSLIVLFVFYLGSVAILILKYYHFQLLENDGRLQITRGLFQIRKTVISIKRIQTVIVKQPLLRTFLGISTIQLVIISNSKEGETEKDIVIMPVIATKKVGEFLQQFLPQIPVKEIEPKLNKWTYYYELRNATLWAIPTLGCLIWIGYSNFWFIIMIIILGLFLLFVPAFLSAKRSKVQYVNKEFLMLQNNKFMIKQVIYIPKSRIQYIEKRSSIWLEQKSIASLLIYIRSGNSKRTFKVNYQAEEDISEIITWYSEK